MKYRLGELIESISKTYDLKNKESVTFVNTGDVFDGSISGNETKIKDLPGQAKKSIELNDILFSEIRPKNKRFALVTGIDPKNYVVSTKLMVLRNKNNLVLDTNYLYFYLTSPLMLAYFQSEAESRSGTFPQITFRENVANIKIDLPPLIEQRKIVQRLSVINDKVKLNNQINDNLLELNSTCFKKIFDTSNDYQPADSIADIKIGKTPPRKQSEWFSISSKDLTWVSIKDMKDNTAFISSSNENITLKAVDRFNINVVPKNTVILSFKLTIGRVKISNHELTTNEAIAQFQNSSLPWEFLYTYLKLFPYGTLGSTSSIAKAINSKIIKKMPVLVPNKSLMNQYLKLAIPIFNSLREIQEEQNKLRSVKQELLTKYF